MTKKSYAITRSETTATKTEGCLSDNGPSAEHSTSSMRRPPTDRYCLVYIIMLLHGVGVLIPWNMLITIAPLYFIQYKLTYFESQDKKTVSYYGQHFFSLIGIFSQVPNLLLNGINILLPTKKGNFIGRIGVSLSAVAASIISIMIMIPINSNNWIDTFFWITMLLVVILNGANGLYQNSVYGLAARFPQRYINAIILGNNLAGTFVAVMNILTLAITTHPIYSAVIYFSIALSVVVLCLGSTFLLKKFPFYTYYSQQAMETEGGENFIQQSPINWTTYREVFFKTFPQLLNVFTIFFVTLTCFPAMTAEIKPLKGEAFFIGDKYFTGVTCFLLFNLFAFLGSLGANFVKFPNRKYLWIPVFGRLIFIPFFFFCNYAPEIRGVMPVYVTSTFVYLLGAVLMSFTSGYYCSLGMMYAPKSVSTNHAPIAGMMSAFSLILGITVGLGFTFAIKWLIKE